MKGHSMAAKDKAKAGLTINGEFHDPDSLTYAERRAVKRIVRTEIWDEDLDGPFDWDEVSSNEVMPATICVLARRHDAEFTLEQALAFTDKDVVFDESVPPTSRGSSAKPKARTSGGAGPQK